MRTKKKTVQQEKNRNSQKSITSKSRNTSLRVGWLAVMAKLQIRSQSDPALRFAKISNRITINSNHIPIKSYIL